MICEGGGEIRNTFERLHPCQVLFLYLLHGVAVAERCSTEAPLDRPTPHLLHPAAYVPGVDDAVHPPIGTPPVNNCQGQAADNVVIQVKKISLNKFKI